MSKRVSLSTAKPRIAAPVEDWIATRHGAGEAPAAPPAPPPEETIRMTFDLVKSLHARLLWASFTRTQQTGKKVTIADITRELIATLPEAPDRKAP